MVHSDDRKAAVKHQSPFTRFARYIRHALGRDHNPTRETKTHGSLDDVGGFPNLANSSGCSQNPRENGAENRVVNRASSVGNLIERHPHPSPGRLPPIPSRFRGSQIFYICDGPFASSMLSMHSCYACSMV
ncbi:hypothetical protein EmuJ_001197600 [Echinococcus multilocularis]|uniref:Uncharacterized protein n=1 Tax=Echinococcus multilocularis TaxID=6211 RepID=A0A068XUI4_ECHMU|nr:hypothetical protein EmuJ_001197600 [Echinococcus multilocularis]